MIPLPLQVKLRTREIITIHHSLAIVAQHRLGHRERHISIRIPKHRPSIFPSAWLQGEHSSHSPSVLEDDAIPFAIRSIDNGTLSDTAIASELGLQDDLLLISSPDMIGTITDFTARMSPRPRNHQEVVLAIMLDHARTLQQVFLLGISLKEATMATFHHCRQVGIELHHLSCGIDDIRLVIIIKEERGIVEVRQTAMDSPHSLDVVSRADIGFATRMVIWCKERIKFASMILQGSSPLTSTIDRAILHFILRRVGQLREDIVDDFPVHQILRLHDRSAWHQVHRGTHHIEIVAHTDDIWVGNVRPSHWILEGCRRLLALRIARHGSSHAAQQYGYK